jgi:hypothetical protein
MTVPKRFGVLRFFGTLLKVIAWIFLVIAVLFAIGAVIAGSTNSISEVLNNAGIDYPFLTAFGGIIGAIVAGIFVLLFGLIYFLVFYVAGEVLHLNLAVEENTRLTAALLLRMHQDGQTDTATAYGTGGGFITEPYEN